MLYSLIINGLMIRLKPTHDPDRSANILNDQDDGDNCVKQTIHTLIIIIALLATSIGVGLAAHADRLIIVALPAALGLIVLLRALGPAAERAAWAIFTVWLGTTYIQLETPLEIGMALLYGGLALLGVYRSPYFLVGAWLFHPIWDSLPRDLPNHLHALPDACILFDIPIGFYILWAIRHQRWSVQTNHKRWWQPMLLASYPAILIILLSLSVLIGVSGDYLLWIAIPVACSLIGATHWLNQQMHLATWAILTGFLGMTYAHTGGVLDQVLFLGFVGLAAYGYFGSSLALVTAWILLCLWSFLPHILPIEYVDLPRAMSLFCLICGGYLAWQFKQQRWNPATTKSNYRI